MYAVRRWSVRRARLLEAIYLRFEPIIVRLHSVFQRIGYARLEKPMVVAERAIKGFLFDCQMCGHCVLTSTGMSCPMNCPKELRNGPCGGVREDGNCEVLPNMQCVWVAAWEGKQRMREGSNIQMVQPPVNAQLRGTSSWLRVVKEKATSE
jgi:hypothetical protein